MKFLILLVLAMGFASTAKAEVLIGLGTSMQFEYSADGRTLETRQPYLLRGGYRFPQVDVYLEYHTFTTAQGSSMLTVSREHREVILWGRKLFLPQWKFNPYVAGGAGFMNETIETRFGSETSRDPGNSQTVLAVAGGFRALVMKNLELGFEARAGYSQSYNPNPMFGLGILIGAVF